MKLFGRLFGVKSIKKKDKRSDFTIEFYPITNRFYPKYKRYYLGKEYGTRIIKTMDDFLFAFADYGSTEKEAEDIITIFKEQRLKNNVVTIYK